MTVDIKVLGLVRKVASAEVDRIKQEEGFEEFLILQDKFYFFKDFGVKSNNSSSVV